MDIIKVLAAFARWHVRVKAFCRGEATWVQVLTEYQRLQEGNLWLYEAVHLRHCAEREELMRWLPAAELAIATVMGDLDRGQLTRVEVKLTIGSAFYRSVGRYKIALHALHQAIEEPMGLRAPLATKKPRQAVVLRSFQEATAS